MKRQLPDQIPRLNQAIEEGMLMFTPKLRTLLAFLKPLDRKYKLMFLLQFSPSILKSLLASILARVFIISPRVLDTWIILSRTPVTFRCSCGLGFLVRLNDIFPSLMESDCKMHVYEPSTSRTVYPLIHGDDVVIDVGAHVGIHTSHFAKRARLVLALEPDPASAAFLSYNIKLNSLENVILVRAAATEWQGAVKLSIDRQSGLSSIFPSTNQAILKDEVVPAVRLESLLKERGIEHARLLKIDVERSEHLVVSGLGAYLDPQVIEMILVEIQPERREHLDRLVAKYHFVSDLKESNNLLLASPSN